MIAPTLSGEKNSAGEIVPAFICAKPVHRLRAAAHGAEQLLQLGRRRLQRRELARELVHRQRVLVAGALVVAHRVVEGARAAEGLVERRRAALGVAEGVLDALRGDRVLRVARVAHERPAGAVRLAEEVRRRRADEPRLALRAAHALGEGRRELERLQEVPLDVLLVRLELGVRPSADDERQAVVGRRRRESAVRTDVGLEAPVHRQAAPVRVVGREERRPLVVPIGLDGLGDERVLAVRPDDDARALRDRARRPSSGP